MSNIYVALILIAGEFSALGLIYWILLRERRKKKFSPFTEASLRSPGYTLGVKRDAAADRLMLPMLGICFAPLAYFFVANQLSTIGALVFSLLLVIALVYFAKQLTILSTAARNLRLGLDGEVYTGQELNFLMRGGAYVYHDIPYKYGNIDHVIISTGGVFVVETKAARKPSGVDGKRQSKVVYQNGKLHFPGFTTGYPIKQAIRHSEYMRSFLKSRTSENFPVTPVVALPGWFVTSSVKDEILVINPKRGAALAKHVSQKNISESQVEIVAKLIEEIARSVRAGAEILDPDASSKYTIMLDRKHEERKIE